MLASPGTGRPELVGVKPDGGNLWPAPVTLPATCAGNPDSLGYSAPVIGADGNIYGLVYYGQGGGCASAYKLYGIDHASGRLSSLTSSIRAAPTMSARMAAAWSSAPRLR